MKWRTLKQLAVSAGIIGIGIALMHSHAAMHSAGAELQLFAVGVWLLGLITIAFGVLFALLAWSSRDQLRDTMREVDSATDTYLRVALDDEEISILQRAGYRVEHDTSGLTMNMLGMDSYHVYRVYKRGY